MKVRLFCSASCSVYNVLWMCASVVCSSVLDRNSLILTIKLGWILIGYLKAQWKTWRTYTLTHKHIHQYSILSLPKPFTEALSSSSEGLKLKLILSPAKKTILSNQKKNSLNMTFLNVDRSFIIYYFSLLPHVKIFWGQKPIFMGVAPLLNSGLLLQT